MNKITVVTIFAFFILYTMGGLFIKIPPFINDIFYALVSGGAIIFIIFFSDIGSDIKSKFKENKSSYSIKKNKN